MSDTVHPVTTPVERNTDMIRVGEVLLAYPKEFYPVQRGSGTWMTWRKAIASKRTRLMIFPDATTESWRDHA